MIDGPLIGLNYMADAKMKNARKRAERGICMNKLTIIGHLTKDAELRTVKVAGVDTPVCNFTVAANYYRRNANGERPVQFVRVTAWRDFATKTAPYLKKGVNVMVSGPARVSVYQSTQDRTWRGQLEITSIDDFEFVSAAKKEEPAETEIDPADAPADADEFPFG